MVSFLRKLFKSSDKPKKPEPRTCTDRFLRPYPVSIGKAKPERYDCALHGEGANEFGVCWFYSTDTKSWELRAGYWCPWIDRKPHIPDRYSHWLPYWAIENPENPWRDRKNA